MVNNFIYSILTAICIFIIGIIFIIGNRLLEGIIIIILSIIMILFKWLKIKFSEKENLPKRKGYYWCGKCQSWHSDIT